MRWVLRNGKKDELLVRWRLNRSLLQGARHGNCCSETSRCQAQAGGETNGLSVLCRRDVSTLGLSHRASSLILSGLQVWVSHMTIWRDVQEEAQKIKEHHQWKPVRILGLDGAHVLGSVCKMQKDG